MILERRELADGVYFTTIPAEKFKTEQLTLYFVMPLSTEDDASRLALIPRVLRRGSAEYPTAADLARRQEELYSADLSGGTFKIGERQILSFSVDYLRQEFVPGGVDLVADVRDLLLGMLFSPHIDPTTGVFVEEYVESEKRNACHAILSLLNNKAAYASRRCLTHMCQGEAYAIHEWGSVEETEKITPASLYAAYRRLLTEAHIEIYYNGTAPVECLTEAILERLRCIHRHPCILPPTVVRREAHRSRTVTERAMTAQGKLCLGFRTGTTLRDEDSAAFMLFHAVYSQSPTSKLFVNVRERLSLCYSCGSRAEMTKGILLVSAGIDNKNRRRAIREILRQLRKMRLGKITEEEMALGVRLLRNHFRSLEDDPVSLRRWYLGRSLVGITETPEEVIERIANVTVRDLARLAKKLSLDTVYFLRGSQEGGEEDYDE